VGYIHLYGHGERRHSVANDTVQKLQVLQNAGNFSSSLPVRTLLRQVHPTFRWVERTTSVVP